MVGRKRTIERRKNKRYKAVDGAYAAISPNLNKLGQIIDISMGGLVFKYIVTNGNEATAVPEDAIFLCSIGLFM
jgi:hypothetical protein